MRLSRGVRYALRLMVDIAKEGDGEKRVSLSQVARSTHMPRAFLEQIATPLRRARLIKGTIGRGGGYVLGRPASDIHASDIVQAVAGPMGITDCALDADSCPLADGCECRLLYTRVNDSINAVLRELSLADLVSDSWRESAHINARRTRSRRKSKKARRAAIS